MKDNETLVEALDPRGQLSGIFGRRIEANSNPGAILDPKIQLTKKLDSMKGLQMAERIETLDDKKTYLVDTGFLEAKEFLAEIQI